MGLGDRLLAAAFRSWGALVSVFGLAAGLILFFVSPDKAEIPLSWSLLLLMVLLSLLSVVARALHDANISANNLSPKVRRITEPLPNYPGAVALMLVEPGSFFSVGAIVSIYFLENELERLVTVGIVTNVQNDKMIQVSLVEEVASSELIGRLKESKPDDLKRVIVKPTVPSQYLRD